MDTPLIPLLREGTTANRETDMDAKGVAFLARKSLIGEQFGKEKWEAFLAEQAEREPYFKTAVLPTTLIPIDIFLRFNEEIIARFFRGDEKAYLVVGEKTAEYSLVDGPYKTYLKSHDYQRLVEDSIPKLWLKFYTDGRVETTYSKGGAEATIMDLPVKHPYFEFAVVGYMKKTLELAGAKGVRFKKVDDETTHYTFKFAE